MELRANAGIPSRVHFLTSVLAGIGVPDPQSTAQQVLDRFGSLAAFASADRSELVSALTAIPALPHALIAAQEIAFAGARERVASSRLDPSNPDFLDYLRLRIGSRRNEILVGFFAGSDQRLICERTLAESEGHALEISAAAILRVAIGVRATDIVLVHNHPSGLANPSEADEAATRELIKRAVVLDIRLSDHLIIGGSRVYSMQQRRVL